MKEPELKTIFEKIHQRIARLLPSDRTYTILYYPNTHEVSFPLVMEKGQQQTWLPRAINPQQMPDALLLEPRIFQFPQNRTKMSLFSSNKENLVSWLGIPIQHENQVLGAIIVERWKTRTEPSPLPFNENDRRTLTLIAQQTAPVIVNRRLQARLRWKVHALQTLNRIGQELTSGLNKSEEDILALIYRGAAEIGLDTDNLYIAFYEEDPAQPDMFQEDALEKREIHGALRFPLVFESGQRVSYPQRKAENGLTEYVIRTHRSFNPPDVDTAYQQLAQDKIGRIPLSWLGVPIMREGKVFGVIVLRNHEYKGIFTQDDMEILEILGGQAAVALQNLELYHAWEEEQQRRLDMERISVFGAVAAEFAHRMNNIAGTIPVRVQMARPYLDASNPRDKKVINQLNKIEAETKILLDAAQAIRQSSETRQAEPVNLREIAETAREIARQLFEGDSSAIGIIIDIPDSITLTVDRNALLDTLTNMIKNALEAVDLQKGEIDIRAEQKNNETSIEIEDNGCGISPEEQKKIFDLFYTTKKKEGKEGLGFGLWRARTFINSLGGDIKVDSKPNEGTVFVLTIPTRQ